jgi:hypothetical protein
MTDSSIWVFGSDSEGRDKVLGPVYGSCISIETSLWISDSPLTKWILPSWSSDKLCVVATQVSAITNSLVSLPVVLSKQINAEVVFPEAQQHNSRRVQADVSPD